MKLEEGLAIIRKDRTKGLQDNDWPNDYLFFNSKGCLKYYFLRENRILNTIREEYYSPWRSWRIIETNKEIKMEEYNLNFEEALAIIRKDSTMIMIPENYSDLYLQFTGTMSGNTGGNLNFYYLSTKELCRDNAISFSYISSKKWKVEELETIEDVMERVEKAMKHSFAPIKECAEKPDILKLIDYIKENKK